MSTPQTYGSQNRLRRDGHRLQLGVVLLLLCGFAFILLLLGWCLPDSASSSASVALAIEPEYPRQLVEFSLTDQSGRAVTRRDLDGKIVVVSFVFTSCSAICPFVNAQMQRIQRQTASQPDVFLLSVTLDPLDDTAPVLANYGRSFGQDPDRWRFLTGDESTVHRLIGTSFLAPETSAAFASMPGAYANSGRIALVNPEGHIVKYFDGMNPKAGDAVVEEIGKLRSSL